MRYKLYTFRCNNLRAPYNRRYTQNYNPKEKLRFAFILGENQQSLICEAKAYKTDKKHLSLIQYLNHMQLGV